MTTRDDLTALVKSLPDSRLLALRLLLEKAKDEKTENRYTVMTRAARLGELQ